MAVLTVSGAQRLDDEATTRSIREIAAYLQESVGQRVAASIAGLADAKQIGRYAQENGPEPHGSTERRLREGYKVVRMLVDAYDAKTARAWLFGINTRLDDRAPIEVLGDATASSEFSAVVRAARQLASFQP
ncbi:MAG: XRE family transcriptional regulator [Actinomycetota bacterium]|nr:XRE family transcriptional regulator [Actinomycetota bacterium]